MRSFYRLHIYRLHINRLNVKRKNMSDDDFAGLVGEDVKPIRVKERVNLTTREADINSAARREAAQDETFVADPLASDPVEMVSPMALLSYCRPGVQHGVFKNLRLGKYTLDARLDLHRLTVEEARTIVYRFVLDCVENDIRSALITHGKGEGREKPALLKSCVAYWLPQMEEVLAFHTAQKQHGSYGATYILLRKSSKKSIENKEKFLNKRKK